MEENRVHPGAADQPVSALLGADYPKCGSCRHWSLDASDWQYEKLALGRCGGIQQREDITEPARAIYDWSAREAEEERLLLEAKAVAVDGSGYYAAVRTTPDFGCVLHSPADGALGRQDGQLRAEHSTVLPPPPSEGGAS